jgi:uncharacterized protein (TIGR02722 family)
MIKRNLLIVAIVLMTIVVLSSCSSGINVSRIDSSKKIDLSGNWNDTDIQIVTKALVDSSLKSNWIDQFRVRNGKNPTVVIGTIINRSSEHIDTAIIAKRFEMALINTNRVDMVADIDLREQVRQEREEQQYYASEESSVALGKELGANFLLQGAVRTVVDQVSGRSVRTYYVSAELIDIETSRKIWVGEESIRKMITQPKYRL